MSFLQSVFGPRPAATRLDAATTAAVARWQALPAADLRGPLAAQRWIVVDVETTGLNLREDRLLAIGAVAVEGDEIRFERSFEVVLRQAAASDAGNILIHRIGGGEQLEGMEAAGALLAFLEYAQKLPCAAFHAAFDEAMLRRAVRETLGIDLGLPFIDLAQLAPALVNDAPPKLGSLDEWTAHFSIEIGARHRAVADALGTAQLLQVLLWRASARSVPSAEHLFKMAREQRWLSGISRR